MDLVAGDAQDILLAITHGRPGRRSRTGGGSRRTWRSAAGSTRPGSTCLPRRPGAWSATTGPGDFLDARIELDGPGRGRRTVDRARRSGLGQAVGRIPERQVDAIASSWIDLRRGRARGLARDEKPWIRELAGRLVAFCRAADRAPDVLFAWSLR